MLIPHKLLIECLRLATLPLVRFCLRYSVSTRDCIEVIKRNFIQCSAEEIAALNEEVNVSRISAMTGLNRREVMRLQKLPDFPDENKSMLHRVLGQWAGDSRFRDKRGRPRALAYKEMDSDFRDLVRLISQDLNPMTVLFELERIGAVEKGEATVKLTRKAYIPTGDAAGIFRMMGGDISDLIQAAGENALQSPEVPHLHAKTHYDRVSADAVPEIKKWMLLEGAALHQRARAFLGQFDADVNTSLPKNLNTVRVALATFSIVQVPGAPEKKKSRKGS